LLTPNNGVRDSNRGNNDIMAILIRRGREMGVPSFTDLREKVSLKPSFCPWNSWTATPGCDPATLFQPTALAGLQQLYNTPGDVELVVGAALSKDYVPASINRNLNNAGIDQTQAWMIFAEIDRIMNKDAFGREVYLDSVNSFFARFKNDDPGSLEGATNLGDFFPGSPFGFAESVLRTKRDRNVQGLIWDNSKTKCVASSAFLKGGRASMFELDTAGANSYMLPNPPFDINNPGYFFGLQSNCDAPEDFFPNYRFPEGNPDGITYPDIFCLDDINYPECWRPSLPFCVQ
jgi:hypothetical protein